MSPYCAPARPGNTAALSPARPRVPRNPGKLRDQVPGKLQAPFLSSHTRSRSLFPTHRTGWVSDSVEVRSSVPGQTPGPLDCCTHPRKPEPPCGQLKAWVWISSLKTENAIERWPTTLTTAFWLLEKPSHLVTVKENTKGNPGNCPAEAATFLKGKTKYIKFSVGQYR